MPPPRSPFSPPASATLIPPPIHRPLLQPPLQSLFSHPLLLSFCRHTLSPKLFRGLESLLHRLRLPDHPRSAGKWQHFSCHIQGWRRVFYSVVGYALTQLSLLPPIPVVPTGNGIQLSGLAEGPITYDLQLDGHTNSSISPSTSGRTLLAEYDGLPPGNHNLSLIAHNPTNSTSAWIAIDHALIPVNSTSPKCVPRR